MNVFRRVVRRRGRAFLAVLSLGIFVAPVQAAPTFCPWAGFADGYESEATAPAGIRFTGARCAEFVAAAGAESLAVSLPIGGTVPPGAQLEVRVDGAPTLTLAANSTSVPLLLPPGAFEVVIVPTVDGAAVGAGDAISVGVRTAMAADWQLESPTSVRPLQPIALRVDGALLQSSTLQATLGAASFTMAAFDGNRVVGLVPEIASGSYSLTVQTPQGTRVFPGFVVGAPNAIANPRTFLNDALAARRAALVTRLADPAFIDARERTDAVRIIQRIDSIAPQLASLSDAQALHAARLIQIVDEDMQNLANVPKAAACNAATQNFRNQLILASLDISHAVAWGALAALVNPVVGVALGVVIAADIVGGRGPQLANSRGAFLDNCVFARVDELLEANGWSNDQRRTAGRDPKAATPYVFEHQVPRRFQIVVDKRVDRTLVEAATHRLRSALGALRTLMERELALSLFAPAEDGGRVLGTPSEYAFDVAGGGPATLTATAAPSYVTLTAASTALPTMLPFTLRHVASGRTRALQASITGATPPSYQLTDSVIGSYSGANVDTERFANSCASGVEMTRIRMATGNFYQWWADLAFFDGPGFYPAAWCFGSGFALHFAFGGRQGVSGGLTVERYEHGKVSGTFDATLQDGVRVTGRFDGVPVK